LSSNSSTYEGIPQAGRGPYWQELQVGAKIKTFGRTVTEADLVNFISCTGMLEHTFIDATHRGVMSGRVVPAALTFGFIEGLLFQTLIQGVGLALLELAIHPKSPVCVGDTIWAIVETTNVRPTSKNNRAVVTSQVTVLNQRDESVLIYEVTRLLEGDPAKS
jgi:3-hydroxybutyryl-CoA dehydratase